MKPVAQTEFVATHGKGNCIQAAVASLLEMELADVPAFRDYPAFEIDDRIDTFLKSRGLRRIILEFTADYVPLSMRVTNCEWRPDADVRLAQPVLAFGKSPRGDFNHAVVGRIWGGEFELLHDPHPDGTGILGFPRTIHFVVPDVKP